MLTPEVLAAAQYLRQTGLPPGGLYAIGYPSTAIQPYFPANIYSDFHGGAYWDWSKRNTADDPAALFASDRRELVLVGYKNLSEKQHWADLLALLGYGVTRHFDGNTFWQTRVFEFESYDLYRKTSEPPRHKQREYGRSGASGPTVERLLRHRRGEIALDREELLRSAQGSARAPNRTALNLSLKLYIPDVADSEIWAR